MCGRPCPGRDFSQDVPWNVSDESMVQQVHDHNAQTEEIKLLAEVLNPVCTEVGHTAAAGWWHVQHNRFLHTKVLCLCVSFRKQMCQVMFPRLAAICVQPLHPVAHVVKQIHLWRPKLVPVIQYQTVVQFGWLGNAHAKVNESGPALNKQNVGGFYVPVKEVLAPAGKGGERVQPSNDGRNGQEQVQQWHRFAGLLQALPSKLVHKLWQLASRLPGEGNTLLHYKLPFRQFAFPFIFGVFAAEVRQPWSG